MRRVFHAYRDDLEVREVFAESIMNVTPWKLWNLKTGGVADGAGTLEAMEVLESAFRDIPASWQHPGLLHLYVHLMEMSPFPERALSAADRLRDLVSDAGQPDPHADPHRRAVRPLPGRPGRQPEGDRRRPQVPGGRGRSTERRRCANGKVVIAAPVLEKVAA
jgi:hypothetical protein